MLGTISGCTLVSKVCTIFLVEATFNFTDKAIYGIRTTNNVCWYSLISDKVFRKKGRMIDDDSLRKTLFYDIVHQYRVSTTTSSVNIYNCYDSVAHTIALLVLQSCGVPKSAISSILLMIHGMEYISLSSMGRLSKSCQ